MGQKHSAKYSLKQSGGSSKQQTVQIEDEVAFNTDSPGRASDDPIGVNLSSIQNDYIRNAANSTTKVWTETTVIESNGRNEKGNEGNEKEFSASETIKRMEANVLDANKPSGPEENLINGIQEKPETEELMPNIEGDVIQNIVVAENSQEEHQNVTPINDSQPSEKPIIHPTEWSEEENIVPDQIISNTTAEECDESNQQIISRNDIQITEQAVVEAKIDFYEENRPNKVKEVDNNELKKEAKVVGTKMSNKSNLNAMEKLVEPNEDTQQKGEEVYGRLILQNGEHQNPILEGIADYVTNQQNVHSDETEEIKTAERKSDGKDDFVSKNEDDKNAEIEIEYLETSNDTEKISAGCDNELKEVDQNRNQNENDDQKLVNGSDEPSSIAKPSEL